MSGQVLTFTRPVGTQRRRVSLKASAVETLQQAGFGHGQEVDILTGGQFSIIDLLEAVLDFTGPADVDLVTWTAAEFDLTQLTHQLTSGSIRRLWMVVDRFFVSRAPLFIQKIVERFGDDCIRTTNTHAKFLTIRNDAWSVTIRTSMNLNFNVRLEYAQVTEDAPRAAWWASIVDQIFAEVPADGLVQKRGQLDLAHADSVIPGKSVSVGSSVRVGA